MANIIIKDTKAKRPFSPKRFITSEKLFKPCPKPGVSGPKMSPIKRDIAMKSPRTSVDLYKNFLIFLNLNISMFYKLSRSKTPAQS